MEKVMFSKKAKHLNNKASYGAAIDLIYYPISLFISQLMRVLSIIMPSFTVMQFTQTWREIFSQSTHYVLFK